MNSELKKLLVYKHLKQNEDDTDIDNENGIFNMKSLYLRYLQNESCILIK